MSNQEVIKQIEAWFGRRDPQHVKLICNDRPTQGPGDDYRVVTEIVFEPHDLHRARVEVWLTDNENIGVGIERLQRVARVLNLNSSSPRFAGGFEPLSVPQHALEKFLDIVADGGLAIRCLVVPLAGVLSTKPSLSAEDIKRLEHLGFPVTNRFVALESPSILGRTIRYEPW